MTDIGIFYFATDYSMRVERVAQEIEQRGFESLWLPEHTHIPSSRKTPYFAGAELPREYIHTLDPFVALASAAAVTDRIKLATGISLIIEHDTIALAKTISTLDHQSDGRVILGVGGGWNREEAEHHGTQWSTRFRKMEEQMQALKEIWTQDVASFDGNFVEFDAIWSWPKPVQDPHPPIVIGGETDYTLRRVVQYANGWLPRARDPQVVIDGISRLHEIANEMQRNPDEISVSVFAPPPRPNVIAQFKELRTDRIILWVPPDSDEDILHRLDRYADYLDN